MPLGGRWFPKSTECQIIAVTVPTLIGDDVRENQEVALPGEFLLLSDFGVAVIKNPAELYKNFICVEAPESQGLLLSAKDLE